MLHSSLLDPSSSQRPSIRNSGRELANDCSESAVCLELLTNEDAASVVGHELTNEGAASAVGVVVSAVGVAEVGEAVW